MLKIASSYKGVEYALAQHAEDKWDWMFFPKIGDPLPRGGEVIGTREHAEIACMRAINRWLKEKGTPS